MKLWYSFNWTFIHNLDFIYKMFFKILQYLKIQDDSNYSSQLSMVKVTLCQIQVLILSEHV